jgi:polysaccharide biosynthesis transport protein
MTTEYELSISDYLSILKRHWGKMLITFVSILLISIAVAVLLQPVYQSKGTILVESQRIPSDLVRATVTSYADERIDVIKQHVMTHDNLFRIIKKYNLYPEKVELATTSDLIAGMRKSVSVELLNAEIAVARGNNATISFNVGFEYEKPEIAHKVANELVTLFLDENVKARTERAVETTEFLTQELDRLKLELETVENKVAIFKQNNANSLPEHLEMHMGMMQRVDSEIKEIDREYKTTQEELRYLDVELTSAQSASKNTGNDVSENSISELDKAKAELERSLILYKETHPTIRAMKRKIETLEKSASPAVEAKPVANDIATDLVIAKIQTQISAAKSRLNSLTDQKRTLQSKVGQLQSQVSKSPQVERGLFTLMRDYENAKAKYEEVKSKQVNAKIAENLESENKAERFSILEPPVFPDKPIKPNRKKIVALGLLAALAAAAALAALLEMLDKRVRGVESLTSLVKMRPLVIIPYISTQAELRRNKNLLRNVVIATITILVLALLIVHFFVTPLDLLILKLTMKLA